MLFKDNPFFSYLESIKNFEKNPYFAVGVSGGPDSMALAIFLNKFVKKYKGKLIALIFDHSIRANSREESEYVKQLLKGLNIKAQIIRPSKKMIVKKNMNSARNNRFDGLVNFCKKENIMHLFLAHHFDDNLETFLMRKLHGSNIEGLDAMSFFSYFRNIQIIRPFINLQKKAIINYNRKNDINYIHDPSNEDLNYTRVKIRKFLENNQIKKEVKNDFIKIKKQIPKYKKMIWELFIKNLISVNRNIVKVDFNNLNDLDDLIIEKHILIILKFFKKNIQIKSDKINNFIKSMKKTDFLVFNLKGVLIEKKSKILIFSQK